MQAWPRKQGEREDLDEDPDVETWAAVAGSATKARDGRADDEPAGRTRDAARRATHGAGPRTAPWASGPPEQFPHGRTTSTTRHHPRT